MFALALLFIGAVASVAGVVLTWSPSAGLIAVGVLCMLAAWDLAG